MNTPNSTTPSLKISLIPIVILVALLSVNVSIYGDSSLNGSIQVILLFATAIASAIAMWRYKIPFRKLEQAMTHHIAGASGAIIMLFLIGALAGIWMLSGVVPAMIYYGLQIIHPHIFLTTACVVSAIVSICTGSSWTTIATIGIALMGIGNALGFHEGWTAGAIISGAYFGDKMSPLSDTTNLASGVAGTDLFVHIRYMWYTTIPTILIACVVYTLVGLYAAPSQITGIEEFRQSLEATYNLSPLLFIVPIITFLLIIKRVPALITLFAAVLLGVIATLLLQPDLCLSLSTNQSNTFSQYFTGIVNTLYAPVSIETGNEALNSLVATRGMSGMLNTVWLIITSMCFGGVMESSGMLHAITNALIKKMHNTFSTVAATTGACLFFNIATADQYISIILPGKMFSSVYQRMGYEPRLLSRTLEDTATVTSVLVPWNSCSMTQSSVLQVASLTFAPYCIFNWLSPIVTLTVAALGYKITKYPIQTTENQQPK